MVQNYIDTTFLHIFLRYFSVSVIFSRLLEAIQKDEKRVGERQTEIEKELCEAKSLMRTCPPELPESYKKYIAEPICDDNEVSRQTSSLKDEWILF